MAVTLISSIFYIKIDFNKLKMHLASPVIFDGRNIYTQETMARHQFHYYSVGRPTITPATVKA